MVLLAMVIVAFIATFEVLGLGTCIKYCEEVPSGNFLPCSLAKVPSGTFAKLVPRLLRKFQVELLQNLCLSRRDLDGLLEVGLPVGTHPF